MIKLKSLSLENRCVPHEYATKNKTEEGKTPYTDKYGRTSVPPPTAVMTSESFKLSMIVLMNAIKKNNSDIGMNLSQRPSKREN